MEEKFLKILKKKWELNYTEQKSITSEDSYLINVKKIKKKLNG